MFANVAPDTDLVSQPRPLGAELSWVLRSSSSPDQQQIAFHVPVGATLGALANDGGVEVLEEGKVALRVPAPVAQDAAGNRVPVSYTVSGTELTMHEDLSGNIQFPVLIDPLFVGEYGTFAGGSDWNGWGKANRGVLAALPGLKGKAIWSGVRGRGRLCTHRGHGGSPRRGMGRGLQASLVWTWLVSTIPGHQIRD